MLLNAPRTPCDQYRSAARARDQKKKIVQNPPCIPIHPFMIDHFQSKLIFSGRVVPHSIDDSVSFSLEWCIMSITHSLFLVYTWITLTAIVITRKG